jgi:hypothetical protein
VKKEGKTMFKENKLGRGSLISSISESKSKILKNDIDFEIIDNFKKIKESVVKNSNENEWVEKVIKPYQRIFNTTQIPEWLLGYHQFLMNPETNKIVSFLEGTLLLSESRGDPYEDELLVYYWLNSIFSLHNSNMLDKNGKLLMLPNEIEERYEEWIECYNEFNNSRRKLQIKENNFYNEILKNKDLVDLIEFLTEKRRTDISDVFIFQIIYSLKKKKIIIKDYLKTSIKRGDEILIDEINLTPFHVEFEEKVFERLNSLTDESDLKEEILSIIKEKVDEWVLSKTNSIIENRLFPNIREFKNQSTTSELYTDDHLLQMINRSSLISDFFRSASSQSEKERLISLIEKVIHS